MDTETESPGMGRFLRILLAANGVVFLILGTVWLSNAASQRYERWFGRPPRLL